LKIDFTQLNTQKVQKIISWIWKGFLFSLAVFFVLIICVRFNVLWLFGSLPDTAELENPKTDLPVEIFSEDGELIGRFFREKRVPVQYEEISQNVIDALVVTEDVRFYEHCGVDGQSVAAIFWYIIKGDQRGGSTITQQLAKNMFKTRKAEGLFSYIPVAKILVIKIKEWITAIRLESNYTKKEILTMYLNTVDFGSNAYGIKVASKRYFNTTPDKLTVPQAAVLIGLLKATTTYSPVLNPENCRERRNVVLNLLYENKKITDNHLKYYSSVPLGIDLQKDLLQEKGIAPYARAEVLEFLQEWCKNNNKDMYSEGLVVHTTLNASMQKYAEEAVQKHMFYLYRRFLSHWQGKNPWIYENEKEIPDFLEEAVKKTKTYKELRAKFGGNKDSINYYLNLPRKMTVFSWKGEIDTTFSTMDSLRYYKHFLHTGFMAVNPHTGEIKAWVGGIDFKYFQYDHVKQARRQPGSAFKPFVYATALQKGFTPCDRITDQALTINYEENGEKKTWSPKNADWVFTGENMTLRKAMARSVNSIAAALMQKVGYDAVIETARKLGVKSDLKAVPALALGASDVSVYELTGAYATFVNNGTYLEPTFISRIEDRKGNILYEGEPHAVKALDEQVAYSMVHMLAGGTEIRGGTSQALFVFDIFRGNQIGGKTGTTSNYSDGWFVGVTKDLVAGMWVGGEDRCIHFTTSSTGEGSKTALPMFGLFMEKVYADTSLGIKHGFFKKPKNFSMNINCPEVYIPKDTTLVSDSTLTESPEDEIF
jgi:penicillin-binding protein 1A